MLGRRDKAAMSSSVETGFHHGDNTDRASKVGTIMHRYRARLTGCQVYGAASEQEAPPAARGNNILGTLSTSPVQRRQSRAGIGSIRDMIVRHAGSDSAWNGVRDC
jgi:hypothetical protein